ncbi:unnamed protein product, partial [Rotaria sp. Silwood1]
KDNNERFSLVEGKDYFISLQNDSSGTLKCNIKCCCEKWTTLVVRRGKFQLSNFYRHLQGLTNECPALKKNINNPPVSSPSSTNNQQPLTTSDNVLQQTASPNSISIIPPSDTIQSNSTSVTASSISKSTEDDEACNENIIEQPSSLKTKRQQKEQEEDNFYMQNIVLFVLVRLLFSCSLIYVTIIGDHFFPAFGDIWHPELVYVPIVQSEPLGGPSGAQSNSTSSRETFVADKGWYSFLLY